MSIKLAVSPVLLIFLLLSHVMLSLSLCLSLSLSLCVSRSLSCSPACTRHGADGQRGEAAAAGTGRLCGMRGRTGRWCTRSGSGHEKRGSHLHSEDRRTTVIYIMSLSFNFSDAEALLGRRPGRRPEEPKQGCEAPLRCEVSKQSCGKSQNAAGEPATHPPASHVDASHARWRGERQLQAARTRAKRVRVRFPWTGRQVRLQV